MNKSSSIGNTILQATCNIIQGAFLLFGPSLVGVGLGAVIAITAPLVFMVGMPLGYGIYAATGNQDKALEVGLKASGIAILLPSILPLLTVALGSGSLALGVNVKGDTIEHLLEHMNKLTGLPMDEINQVKDLVPPSFYKSPSILIDIIRFAARAPS